jgi:hypothetical protein
VNVIEIDLIGDGVPGFLFDFGDNTDARNASVAGFIPERTGRFSLNVRALDIRGCSVLAPGQRIVTVTP